jgi:hypothetical protein
VLTIATNDPIGVCVLNPLRLNDADMNIILI